MTELWRCDKYMTHKERILSLVGNKIDRIQRDKCYETISLRFEAGVFKMIKTENSQLVGDLDKIINS